MVSRSRRKRKRERKEEKKNVKYHQVKNWQIVNSVEVPPDFLS
jgi:hypothetical protein